MKLLKFYFSSLLLLILVTVDSQNCYWQQHVDYTIHVTLDASKHTMAGVEDLVYTNNSPDTLNEVYYHLYFNAFQPNSEMDVRSRTIADPDSRVMDRISKLEPNEWGDYRIRDIAQDKSMVKDFSVNGTILKVTLNKPILPGKTTRLVMNYECQVPVQIRRTGRYNKEGVAYSMSQWYPKLAEYDRNGWATDPYVGREFYGVWGKFNVFLTVPDSFKIAGTGTLVPQTGRSKDRTATPAGFTTHHFVADNVHDFMWAADPHYTIDRISAGPGLDLVFAYKDKPEVAKTWKALQPIMKEAINYASERFGIYPYSQYSFIQGGDGGMEYPMATLVMGELSLNSLVSVCVHEMMHSWYQGVLGFNESLYAWMDEGFTSYAEELVKEHLRSRGLYPGKVSANPFERDASSLINFTLSGKAEPLSTHADHFTTNAAYSVASYVKGELFLSQLGYVIGEEVLRSGLLKFYNTWKFKHPTGQDLINLMERQSGMELDWYYQYMINTTMLPDYSVEKVEDDAAGAKIYLGKKTQMPMPVDITVELKNGTKLFYTIPIDLMREAKKVDVGMPGLKSLEAWNWTNPDYSFRLDVRFADIHSVTIDPSNRMLDSDKKNNKWVSE